MEYALRRTRKEDIETLSAIMKNSFTMEPYSEEWRLDSTKKRLSNILAMPNTFSFTFLNEKKKILGGAFSYVLPYMDKKEAFLIEFFLEKEETGHHLGSMFLKKFLTEAKKAGIDRVALYTYKNLKLFYQKNGFEESKETLMEVKL